MGGLKSILSFTRYLVPFFVLPGDCSNIHFGTSTKFTSDSIIGDIACKMVDCGKGICNGSADDKPPFFFDCQCDPGWTQFKTGNLTLPPCVLPNSCNFTWCGDGICTLTNGGSPTCVCSEGSFNLLNQQSLPCLKQRNLGVD